MDYWGGPKGMLAPPPPPPPPKLLGGPGPPLPTPMLYAAVNLVILFASCLHTVALRDLCAIFLMAAVNFIGVPTLELLRYAHLQNILSLSLPDR